MIFSQSKQAQAVRELLLLAAPLIVSFCVRSLFTFVDTIYASFLSDAAIAAIGLAVPFEFAMIAIWVGTSSGLTSYLSKGIESKNRADDYDIYIHTARYIVYAIVPTFFALGIGLYFLAPHLPYDPVVTADFQIYGTVLICGSAFTSFWSIIPDSIVKAHHDTKSTMIAGLLSNFVNVGLNTLFLFVFEWGIFGIAFSTVLGRLAGLSYALYRAAALEKKLRGELEHSPSSESITKTRWQALTELARLGVPSGLTYVLMSVENIVLNGLFTLVPDSTSAVAAYGIYYRVFMFALMPIVATSVAVLPFIARHHGAGRNEYLKDSFLGVMKVGALYFVIFVAPACFFFADDIFYLLTDTAELIDFGRFAIQLVPFFCLASVPFIISKSTLEGLQQGQAVFYLTVIRYAVISVPLLLGALWLIESFELPSFRTIMYSLLIATTLASIVAYRVTHKTLE